MARCNGCGKDLCEECIGHENYVDGDYREVYCKHCWEIAKPYLDIIAKLEDLEETLYKEMEKKLKKNKRGE